MPSGTIYTQKTVGEIEVKHQRKATNVDEINPYPLSVAQLVSYKSINFLLFFLRRLIETWRSLEINALSTLTD